MNFTEALDILRKGDKGGAKEKEAFETIRSNISSMNDLDLEVILANLVCEMLHSTNPSFSYQLLGAIAESGNKQMEESFVLRQLFVGGTLGSESVLDGVLKCMSALCACTKVFGESSGNIGTRGINDPK